jgi:acetoacetate decarboxylase
MVREGRLTKDKFGYAMPVDAPLYARPPIYYKGAEMISIIYQTDTDAALDLLPEGLGLPEPATASLLFIRYPWSTLGPYEETILGISCLWNGEPKFYIAHIVVNSDIPQAAGREIWGYPKKMATITIGTEGDLLWGKMERPAGHLLCSAGMKPEIPVGELTAAGGSGVSLRIIPSPEEGAPPSLAELIEVPQRNNVPLETWTGPGWAVYHSNSSIDPWHKLPIKQLLGAIYSKYNMELGFGRVIKTY